MVEKPSNRTRALLGLALLSLALTHLLWLSRVAGFHYDEAWAANFAQRIASEKSFWPIAAMSGYTSAWSHYLSAAFFKLFGTSLGVERLSGAALALTGIAMLSLALARSGEKLAAPLFLLMIAFSPTLVTNHRFTVEITTFHVFCFGLLALGVARRSIAQIMIAIVFGVTSHILFIAPALALAASYFFKPKPLQRSERAWILSGLAVLFLFFLHVHLEIPEKEKSFALLALTAILGLLFTSPKSWGIERLQVIAKPLFLLLAIPAGAILLFFAEGSWPSLFFEGSLQAPYLIGLTLIAPLAIAAYAIQKKIQLPWLWFFTVNLVITALIAVKPAPRYFEIPLLLLVVSAAYITARMSPRARTTVIAIWVAAGSAMLWGNYFSPLLAGDFTLGSYRFWIFHDATGDTLPKQVLAHRLGEMGCGLDQVKGADSRTLEGLRFLSIGDWPIVPKACPGTPVPAAYSPKWRIR